MIIDRYLVRQIARPFVLVCILLVAVFAGYASSVFLGAASAGAVSAQTAGLLIALKTVIAMEVLLPIALYLTVVVGLGRMYQNYEMTALRACGFGTSRVLRSVLGIVLPVALFAGVLSVFVRPLAYTQTYALRAEARQAIDISSLKGGRFYFDEKLDRVFYADSVEPDGRITNAFVSVGRGDKRRILSAPGGRVRKQAATQPEGPGGAKGHSLVLEGAHIYSLQTDSLTMASADVFELAVVGRGPEEARYRRKAASTLALTQSSNPEDISELQWRLTRPLSTLLMGLLGVFLAYSNPRGGRNLSVVYAAAVYVAYYTISIVARSWVQHDAVGPFPGMWWVDGLLAVIVAVLIFRAVRVAQEDQGR